MFDFRKVLSVFNEEWEEITNNETRLRNKETRLSNLTEELIQIFLVDSSTQGVNLAVTPIQGNMPLLDILHLIIYLQHIPLQSMLPPTQLVIHLLGTPPPRTPPCTPPRTPPQVTTLQFTPPQVTTLQFTPPQFTTLQFTPTQVTTLQFTPPQFTTLQFTPPHPHKVPQGALPQGTLHNAPQCTLSKGLLQPEVLELLHIMCAMLSSKMKIMEMEKLENSTSRCRCDS